MRVVSLLLILYFLLMTASHAANFSNGASPSPDEAVRKFALVIGNGNYAGYKRNLKNPVNDAKLIADSLFKLGFQVKQYANLDRAGFVNAVGDFASALPPGATAILFYGFCCDSGVETKAAVRLAC